MDLARPIIVVLILAAFALPALAAVLTYRRARAAVNQAASLAQEHERIYGAFLDASRAAGRDDEARAAVSADYRAQFEAIGYRMPTYGNITSAPVEATARALRAVFDGAASNAWLAVLGLVAGAAATIWSLYLPPL